MLQKLNRGIARFDKFGVMPELSFVGDSHLYRSIYGGIATLLVYSFGVFYFVYLIYSWQMRFIPPSISKQTIYTQGLTTLSVDYATFSLGLIDFIDPSKAVRQEGLLYNANAIIYEKQLLTPLKSLPDTNCQLRNDTVTNANFPLICPNLNDPQQKYMQQNPNNRMEDVFLLYTLPYCDASKNSQCMNSTAQDTLLETLQYLQLTITTQQVDIATGDITYTPQTYYFLVGGKHGANKIDLRIRKATVTMDKGFLFPSLTSYEIVSEIDVLHYITPSAQNLDYMALVMVTLDGQEDAISIVYPKVGAILAELGSILQMLFLIGIVIEFVNTRLMTSNFHREMLEVYFPNYSNYEIKKNWRGRVMQVQRKGIPLPEKQETIFIEKSQKIIECINQKTTYVNLLYELNKVQIGVQQVLGREAFQNLYHQAYDIDLELSETVSESGFRLDERDFFMLSGGHKKSDSVRSPKPQITPAEHNDSV